MLKVTGCLKYTHAKETMLILLLYLGPFLNIWNQHPQSGFHGISQEFIYRLLPE